MIQATSKEAFEKLRANGHVCDKQLEVLMAYYKYGDMTNRQLSQKLGWPINCVTPRVNELRKIVYNCQMLVIWKGDVIDSDTGRRAMKWGVNYA